MTTPCAPSTITQSPRPAQVVMRETPTTAGISSARATMAVCEVRAPTSVAKAPTLLPWSRTAVSAGERSWATMIAPAGGVPSTSAARPSRFLMSRSPT